MARRGLVCISFVWEEDTISAVANKSEENTLEKEEFLKRKKDQFEACWAEKQRFDK
jgi:hypothetical protein